LHSENRKFGEIMR